MLILDDNLCELFAAYLHMKTDDLGLIARVIGIEEIGDAIDLCGGYGRAAFALQLLNRRWLIVDRSLEMAEIAQRIFEGQSVDPEFLIAEIGHDDIAMLSSFSTAFSLFNTINDFREINALVDLASRALHLGGRFFLKCIVHDETYN